MNDWQFNCSLYLIHPLDVRTDDMVGCQLPLPDDLSNVSGTLGHEEVLTQLDAGLALVPKPRTEALYRLIDQNVDDDEEVLEQADCNVLDHGLELGVAGLHGIINQ